MAKIANKPAQTQKKGPHRPLGDWLRGLDLNQGPQGYEPCERSKINFTSHGVKNPGAFRPVKTPFVRPGARARSITGSVHFN